MGLLQELFKKGPGKPDYSLLEEYFNRPIEGQNYNNPFDGKIPAPYFIDQKAHGPQFDERGIWQFDTPEGQRFYGGQVQNTYGAQLGGEDSFLNAYERMLTNPSDSLTTEQVNQYTRHGMFDK